MIKNCPTCGNPFESTKFKNRVYCSIPCHKFRYELRPELFWERVNIRGQDECWEWQGYRQRQGYGWLAVRKNGKTTYTLAHRRAWELTNGPVPDGLFVLHKCDNYPCVNPNHMFLGDHVANCADKVAKGRLAWGDKATRRKLNSKDVLHIRSLKGKEKPDAIAMRYGVTANHITNIWARRMWARLP